jgi:hypothetical protein
MLYGVFEIGQGLVVADKLETLLGEFKAVRGRIGNVTSCHGRIRRRLIFNVKSCVILLVFEACESALHARLFDENKGQILLFTTLIW